MKRLIIISNRLPITVQRKEGQLTFQESIGGLAKGLASFYKTHGSFWIGWPGIAREKIKRTEKKTVVETLKMKKCYPVFLSQRHVELYYNGFCNRTIWPLFHYFTEFTEYSDNYWEAYKKVNELFAKAVLEIANEDDVIWVHDYHLMLLPGLLRKKLKNNPIGFFLHIPFPSFEVFRLLPWRNEIIQGLLGADLIGFHTYDYVRHFLSSAHRIGGYEHSYGQIYVDTRLVKVDAFPMGIDFEKFYNSSLEKSVQREIKRIRNKTHNRKIVLSVDRLDYTKGIIRRLETFDYFLDKNPAYKDKVTLILVAVPTRTKIDQYRVIKKQLEELVGKINGKHSALGWVPIWYLYRSLPFKTLAALYNIADVCLVTPLRDGMNLVAKEYVASKRDGKGVLILSEMAGAAKELAEAIIVNPNNREEITEALKKALNMKEREQKKRTKKMQERIRRYNVSRWAKDFIEKLHFIKETQLKLKENRLNKDVEERMLSHYKRSRNRLLLLDYDGTLVPFKERPELARPDKKILNLLRNLTEDERNEVIIVSGRDKHTLEKWFFRLDINLIAEHGGWIKPRGEEWKTLEPFKTDWKEEIRKILEKYVDSTPGSFIEEKEFSLAWHYRKVDYELGLVRARELKDDIFHIVANSDIEILEGHKVIEIKNAGINKGRAVLNWLNSNSWDFILAIGDDWTDEDIFEILPEEAYSIKVGWAPSKAKYYVDDYREIRKLLFEMEELNNETP